MNFIMVEMGGGKQEKGCVEQVGFAGTGLRRISPRALRSTVTTYFIRATYEQENCRNVPNACPSVRLSICLACLE